MKIQSPRDFSVIKLKILLFSFEQLIESIIKILTLIYINDHVHNYHIKQKSSFVIEYWSKQGFFPV
jgi:hypothetical protein